MKSLTRTIIVLVIINLVIGNFALAQNTSYEGNAEPVEPLRSAARAPRHPEEPIPATLPELIPEPEPVPTPTTAPPVSRPYPTQPRRPARISSRKVLVIPATDVKAEDLAAITEDLQVMSHIFDERFKEPREIKGVFVDFGDFFGRDSRSTEAIYIQGYGTLFLMEVNFAFSPPPEAQEKQAEETEDVDPIWQRAKQKMFSPQGFGGGTYVPEEQYSADKIDQIKTELIRTLKHTANIRNLQPDERLILTVIGQSRQSGGMYEEYYRNAAPRSGLSRSRGRSSSRGRSPYGGSGGMGGGIGGGGIGGGSFGGGGFGGGIGGGSFGGGGFGGGMYGGMEYGSGMEYGETGSPSTTVLTIRAKKSDVDDFARGELDFEEFQKKVDIFTY